MLGLAGFQDPDPGDGGHELLEQRQPLGDQIGVRVGQAGDVSTRAGETGDEARPDRIGLTHEHDGDPVRCLLGRERGAGGRGDQHVDLETNELRGQRREARDLSGRIPLRDHERVALDVAVLSQARPEGGEPGLVLGEVHGDQ